MTGKISSAKISLYMRRKAGSLLAIERSVLATAMDLKRRGEKDFYGFAIAKGLSGQGGQESARRLVFHGTLYKALDRLESSGLVDSTWEDPALAADAGRPRRRLYRVTALGEQALIRAEDSPALVAGESYA